MVFGISTAREFYDKIVIPQYEEFLRRNSDPRLAILTIIVAYHLYEWENHDEFTEAKFKILYPNDSGVSELFEISRRVANGSKHSNLKVVHTKTQTGFSSAFSDAFSRPLILVKSDGTEVSADSLIEKLICFWKKQFI